MLCLAFKQGAVAFVEAAEDEGGVGSHYAYKAGHIGQKDVAIDVGEDNVELSSETTEHGAIATERRQALIDMVDNGIMARVGSTPLVDIVAHAGVGSQLESANAQDACATSAVQDTLALKVHIE